MPKRGQNTGSVSRRKDGRWEARLSLPDGRRRSFYGVTRAEAEGKLDEARRDLASGVLADPGRMTVADLGREWLAAIEGQLRRNTVRGHRSRWRTYVLPTIGSVPLRAVSGAHVQRVLSEARRAGLSDGTIRALHHSMGAAFRHAVAWGLLSQNPVRGVAVPAASSRELPLDRPEQITALLAELQASPYRVALLLALTLGLRDAEIRGLRWRDVDLEAGRLSVRNNLETIGGVRGEVRFVPPKTRRSRRSLPLPDFVVLLLRTHRAAQNETRLRAGDTWRDLDLIVTGRYPGYPLSHSTLNRQLVDACERAGLPTLTTHHLRHLCATILMMRGVSPRVVQDILGHSSVSTTMAIYSHVQPALLAEAADAMEDALSGIGS